MQAVPGYIGCQHDLCQVDIQKHRAKKIFDSFERVLRAHAACAGSLVHEFGHFGITKHVFRHMPSHLTTLTFHRGFPSLRGLDKLRSLTSLTLGSEDLTTGLKYITGLTRLECRG